jgi:hypothetical protein
MSLVSENLFLFEGKSYLKYSQYDKILLEDNAKQPVNVCGS